MRRLFFDRWGLRLWAGLTLVALVLALLGGIVAVAVRRGDYVSCRNTAHSMHREFRSGILEGCLIRLDDGTFIPLKNLRTTDVERRAS